MGDYFTKDNYIVENEKVDIDYEKMKRMIFKIYAQERENAKTGRYGEREMKDIIKNIIEKEAGKCY